MQSIYMKKYFKYKYKNLLNCNLYKFSTNTNTDTNTDTNPDTGQVTNTVTNPDTNTVTNPDTNTVTNPDTNIDIDTESNNVVNVNIDIDNVTNIDENIRDLQLSINFIWFSQEINNSIEPHIFANSKKEYLDDFLKYSKLWIEKNIGCTLILYYDSRYYHNKTITNTSEFIEGYLGDLWNHFQLRDICKTNTYKKYSRLLDSRLNVFFRTDVCRFIISYEQVYNDPSVLFFYTDLNIEPVDIKTTIINQPKSKKIFEAYSIMFLQYEFTFDIATTGILGFENKILVLKHDTTLLSVIEKVMFQLLNNSILNSFGCIDIREMQKIDQYIYDFIPHFMVYLIHQKKKSFVNIDGTNYEKIVGSSIRNCILLNNFFNDKCSNMAVISTQNLNQYTFNYNGIKTNASKLCSITSKYYLTMEDMYLMFNREINGIRERIVRYIREIIHNISRTEFSLDLKQIVKDIESRKNNSYDIKPYLLKLIIDVKKFKDYVDKNMDESKKKSIKNDNTKINKLFKKLEEYSEELNKNDSTKISYIKKIIENKNETDKEYDEYFVIPVLRLNSRLSRFG